MEPGVVGCGFFAQNHLHAWSDLKPRGIEIAAVCDVDPAKAKPAAERFRVPHWHFDAETMFRERRLGLVDSVTRVDTNPPLVELAIPHKLPIVQKPFGPDVAAGLAMTAAAQSAGLFLAVYENFRFQAPMPYASGRRL